MYYRTFTEINLDNLEYNVDNARRKLPQGVRLLEVIKANAYGHGAVGIAKFLEGKCDFFGVACVDEAAELIQAGITTPILILGYVSPSEYEFVVKNSVRIPIFRLEDAKKLSAEAIRQQKNTPFHFCVDTGMSRIGFQVEEKAADTCAQIAALKGIYPEGMFSHFATADEADLSKALAQRAQFDRFIQLLEERNIYIPIKHINNSAGIMNFDKYYDMCRMGITTYGLYPSHEVNEALLDVRPVMTWKAHITHIKMLPAGREISYGGTFKTTKDTRVATVSVGYADGYPRCLSNSGKVIINGKYAPILGRVTMDQIMVDITEIGDAEIENEVILIGRQGEAQLTMEEVSEAAYSFNYELPCRISPRVHREFLKNGKPFKS